MAGETLLVVDESLVHARLLSVFLENAGYQVHVASDFEQALEKTQMVRPFLVLVDIHIPRQGGMALVRKIRSNPQNLKMKILMITDSVVIEEEKLMEAGCDGYLSKPVDTRDLPRIIGGFIEK